MSSACIRQSRHSLFLICPARGFVFLNPSKGNNMATVAYGDISPRTAAYAEKELLKRGIPYLVLEKFGQAKSLPSNSTKVEKFRRYNALSNTPVTITEGITPASQALTVTDVTATLQQYGGLVQVSDIILDTHEDATLNEAINLLGEQALRQRRCTQCGQYRDLHGQSA
jgi:N4-gp56 family major capsid protein